MPKKTIELDLFDGNHKWAHVEDDGERTLIGMYEDGKVARTLFYIERERLKQLADALIMLCQKYK